MSLTKKLMIAVLVVGVLVIALSLSINGAARSGQIMPATVPVVADPLGEARVAMDAGLYPEALAYYMQVPKGDPNYARAQRFIGWKLYGDELERPLAGLKYVHRALLAEPFTSNSWEDASRAYGSAIKSVFTK